MTKKPLVIPAWTAPPEQEIRDADRVVAEVRSERADGIRAGLLVAAECETYADAGRELNDATAARHANAYRAALAETLAWLVGCAPPPVGLPRRNRNGDLVTADELYAEMARGHTTWGPEERRAARDEADRQYARAVRLDDLA